MGTLSLVLFCEKPHQRNMKLLFAASLMLSSRVFVDAFFTEKCDHANVTVSLRNLRSCVNKKEKKSDDFCSTFKHSRDCVFENMKKCFKEDDIEEEAKSFLADVKRDATRFLL